MTYYISIGNSDDKLTQREWFHFLRSMEATIVGVASTVHGYWLSAPNTPYQNACWGFDMADELIPELRDRLQVLKEQYRQDSIAWAEAETQFI